jgi:transposase
MDAIEQLKQDVREGRIDPDRLIGLLVTSQRQLEEANRRIAELEKKLGGSATVKTSEPFSMRAEEQRQQARGKKTQKRKRPLRRGRISTADKLLLAERTERVFPVGIAQNDCRLSHTRPVWRLENGRAVLVAYEVYRGPKNRFGEIPGTLGRSEFGLEFILAIAYQVYIVGLSFDKVCLLMNFFQNLRLRKSQIDALMNQLSRHWASEFDRLCTLLANSAVVHTDETGWSLRSVWAFLSEKVRVLFFGVHKDADTLSQILDPATFAGLVISDDAAVYANFTNAQKCWAHLLRKAIKLTLLEPDNAEYRTLTDRLLEIYRAACRVQADGRLSDAGRQRKVAALDDEVFDLCAPIWVADLPPLEGTVDDYRLLCNELMRLMLAQQLFTFVTAAAVVTPSGETRPVSGTNNEAERTLRSAAQARKTGRTNKTFAGARRQTIITSVMESLRQQLPTFTLPTVIEEVLRWQRAGRSCFANLTTQLKLLSPTHSVLDILLPVPAG